MKAFSSVSSTFLSMVFPKKDSTNTAYIALSEIPESVALCFDSPTGLVERREMVLDRKDRNAYWYSQEMDIFNSDELFSYFFCIRPKTSEPLYYGKNGLNRWAPKLADRFILTPGVSYPEWIAGRTCYQILPDRFCNGDSSNDYVDDEYSFDGTEVKTMKWGEKPLYFNEGRCLDFYSGDLRGMEEKLPYLKDLGFDTIYINPINSSLTIHRYDSIDFFHVDEHLGGDEAFESFMKKAHGMDMKVIVDISINHTGTAHPWFISASTEEDSQYREFYYRNEDGTFRYWQGVPTLPQLNYNSQKLRDIIYRNADSCMQKYLQKPYEIDGWRMDVAPEVARAGKDQMSHEVWKELRKHIKKCKDDAYILGEAWDDSREYLHGDEWDGIMNYYGAGRPLRAWMGEEDRFLSDGWGHSPKEMEPLTSHEMITWLKDGMDTTEDQRCYMQMNLIDSHDTPRLHNHRVLMDDDRYLGTILALYMLPGMPSTYYGDEVEIDGEMGSVEMSRYPMEWDENRQNATWKAWWQKLGKIRKIEGFSLSATRFIEIDDECFAIERIMRGKTVVAIINRAKKDRAITLDDFCLGTSYTTLIGNLREVEGKICIPAGCSGAFLVR